MPRSTIWVMVAGLLIAGVLAVTLKPAAVDAPARECPEISIVIDRSNAMHGLKDGKLFAYIDLTEVASDLACHTDTEIQAPLVSAVTASVNEWWKEPRFATASRAEIHIITILDKDEYARANLNAALTHGKIEFTREGESIAALPASLAFDNLRTSLDKKK